MDIQTAERRSPTTLVKTSSSYHPTTTHTVLFENEIINYCSLFRGARREAKPSLTVRTPPYSRSGGGGVAANRALRKLKTEPRTRGWAQQQRLWTWEASFLGVRRRETPVKRRKMGYMNTESGKRKTSGTRERLNNVSVRFFSFLEKEREQHRVSKQRVDRSNRQQELGDDRVSIDFWQHNE